MKSFIKRVMNPIGFLCLALCLWANGAESQELTQQPLAFAGQWPYHSSKGIAMDVDRDLVFLGDGDRMDILDINLNLISSMAVTRSGLISGLFYSASDRTLYIACKNDGLRMVDVSDPENPFIAGVYFSDLSTTEINSVFVEGDRAYLAAGIDGLIILNITDTANPEFLSQSWLPGGFGISYAIDIVASGNFAWVADLYSGIHVVDVTDPAKPTYEKGIVLAGAHDMALNGNYLYTTLEGTGMAITNIANPTAPTVDSLFVANDGVETSVRVADNLAYVGYWSGGLRVIDVTDSANPVHNPAWIFTDSGCTSIGLLDSQANLYITNDQVGLEKIDISDKTAMQSVLSYDTPADAIAVDVFNDYAVIVDDNTGIAPQNEGLRIIWLSPFKDVIQLYLKGFCPTPGKASDVTVFGDFAFVADGEMGLQIIDMADKTAPVIIGASDTPGFASGAFVSGNYAFVADGDMGMAVVDITDKAAPFLIGSVDTPGIAAKLAVSGDYAFIADGVAGLQIINVADKSAPVIIGVCDTPGFASGVFVRENYAFVADGDRGMAVVDITDKAAPTRVTSVDTPGFAGNISVIGDNAYVADGEEGVVVINVAIPDQPIKKDDLSYNSGGFAADISSGYTSEEEALFTFIADGPAGLIALNVVSDNINNPVNSGGGSAGCFIQAAGNK